MDLSIDDIQWCQARQFGYKDWDEVIHMDKPINHQFEEALDYLLEGHQDKLSILLSNQPDLLTRHSAFGHKATLLHYVAANGVETYRQIVPDNIVSSTNILMESGADTRADHNIYQGQCSLIDLIETSAHPNEAGVADQLIQLLEGGQ